MEFPQNFYNLVKQRKTKDDKILKSIECLINEYLNDDGTITDNESFVHFLRNVVCNCILWSEFENYDDCLELITCKPHIFNTPLTEKTYMLDYFVSTSLRIRDMITTSLHFETIAEMLFKIGLYGLTLSDLELHFTFFKDSYRNIDTEQVKKINIIAKQFHPIKNREFSVLSYKIFELGHLDSKTINLENNEIKKIIIENPSIMFARVALEVCEDMNNVGYVYENLYRCNFSTATPMFYNSLKKYNMMTSCFLISSEDSITSFANLFKKNCNVQKYNAGVGLMFNNFRSRGSKVMDGITLSNGIKPYIKIVSILATSFKNSMRNRSSSVNINVDITTPDLENFLELKFNKNRKMDDCLDYVFQTVSIPDEFMYRLISNKPWYYISSSENINGKHLYDVVGNEYCELYNKMVADPKIIKTAVSPFQVLCKIVQAHLHTGGPFLFFRDIVNETSNQKNIGIIKGTNLCTEIFEYSDEFETACCNLSSLNLKKCVISKDGEKYFDYNILSTHVKTLVQILNKTIDNAFYPDESCKTSNMKHRPIGIGIQGLQEVCFELEIPYDKAEFLFREIAEVIYYSALEESNNLVKTEVYENYDKDKTSPLLNGKFSFDLFKEYNNNRIKKLESLLSENEDNPLVKDSLKTVKNLNFEPTFYKKEDWDRLKRSIMKYGLANSLLIAYMPTSLSSGIYGNTESFEMQTHNIIKREFSKFNYICYNKYLVKYLIDNKFYNENNVISALIKCNNNIDLLEIPSRNKSYIKKHFKTIHNIKPEDYNKLTSSMNHFIDQGKSRNIYGQSDLDEHKTPDEQKHVFSALIKNLINIWLYGNKSTYYFRVEKQETINITNKNEEQISEENNIDKNKNSSDFVCTRDNKDCIACSA